MPNDQKAIANSYLEQKENILNESLLLTESLIQSIGDRQKTTDLLLKRKKLLMQLDQLDQTFSNDLSNYQFDEADLLRLETLAEKLWLLDDKITQAMRNNKEQILQSLQNQ